MLLRAFDGLRRLHEGLCRTRHRQYKAQLQCLHRLLKDAAVFRSMVEQIQAQEPEFNPDDWITDHVVNARRGLHTWPDEEPKKMKVLYRAIQRMTDEKDEPISWGQQLCIGGNFNEGTNLVTEEVVTPLVEYLASRLGTESQTAAPRPMATPRKPIMWKPIQAPEDLPQPGERETAVLDFKAAPTDDRFELAKDVAAFANGLGGTILVGGVGGDNLVRFEPLERSAAHAAARGYDEAVRDRCSPAPMFTVDEINLEAGTAVVLAINVWPFPGQLVGVRLKREEVSCGGRGSHHDGAFLFPVRVGTHTKFVTPEQIPMFVDPHARRIAISLSQAVGKRVMLFATKYRTEKASWMTPATVKDVDLIGNSLLLSVDTAGGGAEEVAVPLDFVDAACHAGGAYQVFLRGVVKPVDWISSATEELKKIRMFFDPRG